MFTLVVLGGDVLLSVQGITVANAEDRAKMAKALETLQAGQELRVTALSVALFVWGLGLPYPLIADF